jgi:hypothetical protein
MSFHQSNLETLSSPSTSSEFSVDYQLVNSISPIQSRAHSPIPVIGETMTAAEDLFGVPSVEPKPALQCIDSDESENYPGLLAKNIEKTPVHESEHKTSLRMHERFYFKDGNITFIVCTFVIFTTLERCGN